MNVLSVVAARYYVVLLARSQRWLGPVLFYAIALAVDSAGGSSAAEAFAYNAAFLLPVAAWLTRAVLTVEAPESAAITATALGPVRARLAALAAATGYSLLCALVGALVAATTGGIGGASTLVAGLGTELICVLLGTGVGVLTAPPLVPAVGWGLLLSGLIALGMLVARFSPAAMGIRALTQASNAATAHAHLPLVALPAAVVLVAAAWAVSTAAAIRR